jgi:hypothetical protein
MRSAPAVSSCIHAQRSHANAHAHTESSVESIQGFHLGAVQCTCRERVGGIQMGVQHVCTVDYRGMRRLPETVRETCRPGQTLQIKRAGSEFVCTCTCKYRTMPYLSPISRRGFVTRHNEDNSPTDQMGDDSNAPKPRALNSSGRPSEPIYLVSPHSTPTQHPPTHPVTVHATHKLCDMQRGSL